MGFLVSSLRICVVLSLRMCFPVGKPDPNAITNANPDPQPDPNAIANANPDPPTPANRVVQIHGWHLVIVLCACRTRACAHLYPIRSPQIIEKLKILSHLYPIRNQKIKN